MSVQERFYLIECINDKAEEEQKIWDRKLAESKTKNKQ